MNLKQRYPQVKTETKHQKTHKPIQKPDTKQAIITRMRWRGLDRGVDNGKTKF